MRSTAELADAIPPADRVLVADPGLATALRRHLGGQVAVETPEGAVEAPETDRLDLLASLYAAHDAPASAASRAIDARLRAWRHRGSVTAGAADELARSVAEGLRDLPSQERSLERADPVEGVDAVVVPETFDRLQRSVVPEGVRRIPGATGESMESLAVETAPSRWASAVSAARAVTKSGGTIVADPAGPYWALVRAALGAPGNDGDDGRWSAALELLDLAGSEAPVRVADARTVLAALGVDVPDGPDRRPLDALEDERARWANAIAQHGRSQLTVGRIIEQFADRGGGEHDRIERAVSVLGVADEAPTGRVVADLEWLVRDGPPRAPDPPHLVDGKRARDFGTEVAHFLGLDADWLRPPPPGGADGWNARERQRVAGLLAGPEERHVHLAEADLDACGLDGLTVDATSGPLRGSEGAPTGVQFEPEGRVRARGDRLSKSRLNRLLRSPRDALYADVLSMPEAGARIRGTGVHDYAELALAAPAAVDAVGRETLIEAIVDDVAELVPERRRPVVETRIRAATAVIDAYITDVDPPTAGIDGFDSRSWLVNALAERFGVSVSSSVTEQYFVDDELGVSGVVDLIRSPTHLVDFKTGSPPPLPAVVARGRKERTHDVQLPLYLAALRRRRPDRALRMTFVYCHGALGGALNATPWLSSLERSVPYRPTSSERLVSEPRSIEALRDAVPEGHPGRILVDRLGANAVADLLEGLAPTDRATIQARLRERAQETDLDEGVARVGARALAVGIEDQYERGLHREDLDRFEAALEGWHRRRDRYERDGYPLGDPDERRLDFSELHPDLSPVGMRGTDR